MAPLAAVVALMGGCAGPQPARQPEGTASTAAPAAASPGAAEPAAAMATAERAQAPALGGAEGGLVPVDLQIDVTVLVGKGMPESLRIEERNGRYVLLPDGALHADVGPSLTQASRPGRARWLYEQHMAAVWATCRDLGFADTSLANGPANPDMLRVERGERVTILAFAAQGRRWCFVRRSLGDQPTDAAAARLVRLLAALAWMPDLTPEDIAPERYDYGPDPYAVYRAIRAEQNRGP